MNEHREESELFLSRLFAKSYRVIKSLNSLYLAEMGYHDFKIGHIMVMMNLKEEGITAAEISKKVHVSKQAISKLVHELAEKGFLMNLKHPEDLRATLIQTTVAGEQFLAALNIKYGKFSTPQPQRRCCLYKIFLHFILGLLLNPIFILNLVAITGSFSNLNYIQDFKHNYLFCNLI
jgi:DNA-binding MarR family transcriptional regulator